MWTRKCLLDRGLSCARRRQQLRLNFRRILGGVCSLYLCVCVCVFFLWIGFSMWSLFLAALQDMYQRPVHLFDMLSTTNTTQWVTINVVNAETINAWCGEGFFFFFNTASPKIRYWLFPLVLTSQHRFYLFKGSQVAGDGSADASGQQDEDWVHQDADPQSQPDQRAELWQQRRDGWVCVCVLLIHVFRISRQSVSHYPRNDAGKIFTEV